MSLVLSGNGDITGLDPALFQSNEMGFLQSGTGAVATTVQTKLRESVSVLDFGAVGDGTTNDLAAILLAIAALPATGGDVYFPAGTYNIGSGATGVVVAGTTARTIRLHGDGGKASTIKYTGSGDAVLFTNTAGTSILAGFDGIAIDCSASANSANGLHVNGVWRSYFKDFYIVGKGGATSTGAGLLLDNTTDGTFDVKTYNPYITGFNTNVKCVGGNLSTTAVTNFTMVGGYVSSGNVNFYFSFCLDVCILGTQAELAILDGIQINNTNNLTWSGAIEGNGRYGVNFGTACNGAFINAGMFNNATSNFNGTPTNFQYISSAAIDMYGTLLRLNDTLGGKGYLSFFKNGISDAKFGISTAASNGISLYDGFTSNTEQIVFDATQALVDVVNSAGGVRLRTGANLRYFVGGVDVTQSAASVMPASGTWNKGSIVWNTNPSNAAGQPAGWIRVNTGSGNVLNTDWRVFGVTT